MMEAPEGATGTTARTRRSTRAMQSLLPLYYLLAAFGLLTVAMSLYLNHRIMVIYAGSVEANQKWAQRLTRYAELGQLAAAVNEPGNDVFHSHDVKAEAAAMHTALSRFNESLAALRDELRANGDARRAAPLVQDLEAAGAAMTEMADEAARLFAYLTRNQSKLAAERMAVMDRKYADVNAALARLRGHIGVIQKERLDEEIRTATTSQKLEYVIGGLAALMVGAVTAYGYTLTRQGAAYERERERYIESLRNAEARTRSILDTAADGIITFDEHGVIESVNQATEAIFGDSASELIGQNLSGLLLRPSPAEPDGGPPGSLPGCEAEGLDRHRPCRLADLTGRRSEVVGRRKDGTAFPLDLAVSEMPVGPRRTFTGVLRDITERKRSDEQLRSSREQLRDLAAHLESVREDERSRIAREVHDELGQMLTGLKMGLTWLASRLPEDGAALREKVRAMSTLTDATIQSVRRISTELRPPMLDELGLVAAVEWQAQEFQARTGIECQCSSDLAYLEPNREVATAMFRILQEALTNVARHAGATRVSISLAEDGDRVVLAVEDDGRGITAAAVADTKSLGLLGMQERSRLLGGEVTIAARPGEGTAVTVSIPCRGLSGSTAPEE